MKRQDLNIMASVKAIEDLKAELVCIVGDLFKLMARGSNAAQNSILECISAGIMTLYILGDRLGHNHESIDECMDKKLKAGIDAQDMYEKERKDLSRLRAHLRVREVSRYKER